MKKTFLFVVSPTLLLYGDSITTITIDTITVAIGVYGVSVAAIGYFCREQSLFTRLLLIVSGVAAMIPDHAFGLYYWADIIGSCSVILLLVKEFLSRNN